MKIALKGNRSKNIAFVSKDCILTKWITDKDCVLLPPYVNWKFRVTLFALYKMCFLFLILIIIFLYLSIQRFLKLKVWKKCKKENIFIKNARGALCVIRVIIGTLALHCTARLSCLHLFEQDAVSAGSDRATKYVQSSERELKTRVEQMWTDIKMKLGQRTEIVAPWASVGDKNIKTNFKQMFMHWQIAESLLTSTTQNFTPVFCFHLVYVINKQWMEGMFSSISQSQYSEAYLNSTSWSRSTLQWDH